MRAMSNLGRLPACGRGMVRAATHRVREQTGQAVVEFAILLFPLALIVIGILDFGRALNYYNDLTQLAGQGARAAAVNQNPNGGVLTNATFRTQLAGNADSPELAHATVCISGPNWPPHTGDPITVQVKHDFAFKAIIRVAAITLSSSQTVRFEAPATGLQQGCTTS